MSHPEQPRIDNLDGFKNELTGIGDPSRDKTLAATVDLSLVTAYEAETLWRGSDLGARIVETIPDEMTRAGHDLLIQPAEGSDAKEGEELADELQRLAGDMSAMEAVNECLRYVRAYGGGAILVGADDGVDNLAEPLREDSIRSVRHLTAFRGGWGGELIAWSYYGKDPKHPKFGLPEVYMLRNIGVPLSSVPAPGVAPNPSQQQAAPVTIAYVHESRLLIFGGNVTSRWARTQMQGWGDSVFTRCKRVLSQYDQTWGGVSILMSEFSMATLSMDGLAQLLASNDTSDSGIVAKRALALQMSQSIARMRLIDSNEKFERVTATLTGVPEVLQQFAHRLAAAADMPVSLLMGQAPAGLNATGASDIRFFYDRIASWQRTRMVPQLARLYRLMMLAKDSPTGGTVPAKWEVVPRPLWQLTELEQADLRVKQSQVDRTYIDAQVLTPEEVTASRFGGAVYSTNTVVDLEARASAPSQPAQEPAPDPVPGDTA